MPILIVAGFLVVLLLAKIFIFFTAKPKITVDYVAQYNEFSRPQDYDSSENAALYYQKAFNTFIQMPDELSNLEPWSDMNDPDKKLLQDWLAANAEAFELYRKATQKPYCWQERIPLDTPPRMGDFMVSELNSHRIIADALVWSAKDHSAESQFQSAFEALITCYRAGGHQCHPNLLLFEQLLGLRLKGTAVENAFFIIDKYDIPSDALKLFQDALTKELEDDVYVPSLQTEKFTAYDILQRTFIDNGSGTGRWAWSTGWPRCLCGPDSDLKELQRRLYFCLFGPTRKDIKNQIDWALTQSDQIMQKTPWQVKNQNPDLFDKIHKIKNSHIVFVGDTFTINPECLLNVYYQTKTQTEALVTVLAILRYRNDTSKLPESLDKLMDTGYLQNIPKDPYSNSSLIYKVRGDTFSLYSVGEDFMDNGGLIVQDDVWKEEISIAVKSPDIVYWQIKIIEPKPIEKDMIMDMPEMFQKF